VYNGVRQLELLFLALDRQSFTDFEVIIADDGSGPEIAELVSARRDSAGYGVVHLWQPDAGFRKNAMLNRAIVAAGSDYMVFTDGDCLPHRHFLADHWMHREPEGVLCGRRVNLGPAMSAKVTHAAVRDGSFERISVALLADGLKGGSANIEDAIRTENRLLRRILHPGPPGILGCNFSVHREMLERVNGFNEEYAAPGLGEDSDVAFRLGLAGGTLRSLRNLAILFHLHHPRTEVGEENKRLYRRVVSSGEMICRKGIRPLEGSAHAS
jgi:glycosyltransferase involved in cell wall biosynthesis